MKCVRCGSFYFSGGKCPNCGCSPGDEKIVFSPSMIDLKTMGRAFSKHGYHVGEVELNDMPVLSLQHESNELPMFLLGFVKADSHKTGLILVMPVPIADIPSVQSYFEQLNKLNSVVSSFKFVVNGKEELIALALLPVFSRITSFGLACEIETEVIYARRFITENLKDYISAGWQQGNVNGKS